MSNTTTFIETTVTLRKAELWDLFHNGLNKHLGQPYWVKSIHTNQFDNRCYLVNQFTNANELKAWADRGMVYVPASDHELKRLQKTPEMAPATAQQPELTLNQ